MHHALVIVLLHLCTAYHIAFAQSEYYQSVQLLPNNDAKTWQKVLDKGFKEVLIRVSGTERVLPEENFNNTHDLEQTLDHYTTRTHPESGQPEVLLQFNPQRINRIVHQQGFEVVEMHERPTLTLCLQLSADDDSASNPVVHQAHPLAESITQQAKKRGLSLLLPDESNLHTCQDVSWPSPSTPLLPPGLPASSVLALYTPEENRIYITQLNNFGEPQSSQDVYAPSITAGAESLIDHISEKTLPKHRLDPEHAFDRTTLAISGITHRSMLIRAQKSLTSLAKHTSLTLVRVHDQTVYLDVKTPNIESFLDKVRQSPYFQISQSSNQDSTTTHLLWLTH